MATLELMTWNKTDRRWHKGYRGTRYAVSPRQLKCEPTKEASRVAANDWWTKKQAEIDEALGKAKQHPAHIVRDYESAQYNHRLYAKWQRKYGDVELAEKSEAIMEWLHQGLRSDNPPYPLEPWQSDPLHEAWMSEQGFGMWIERLNQIYREEREEKAVPRENTIRAHIDDYLAFRRAKVASGKNTLGTFDTFRGRLMTFRKWCDPFAPVESLNEALWERYYAYLAKQVEAGVMSQSTMSTTLGAARQFIRSRWDKRLIELPRNLNSRDLAVSPPLKEIEVFTVDEVKALMAAASEREKLYLCLMLNCGFYPSDIAALKQTEYRDGRITRKRTKTRSRSEQVPLVCWLLWKETDQLLTKHNSQDPEHILLNRNGSPLWNEKETEGKAWVVRNSNIRCNFFRLQKKTGIKKPLAKLRKTSATLLGSHPGFGKYVQFFLGQAPKTIAESHYDKPTQKRFDSAIRWLGKQYGIE
jgi:hypothetical protein